MTRIDLSKPYENFLKSQIEVGLSSSITAVAENAIARQMGKNEEIRIGSIRYFIPRGEKEVWDRRSIQYTPSLMAEIPQKGKAAALTGERLKNEIR